MIWPFTRTKPSLPELQKEAPDRGPRRFVIPDIHGCNLTLAALIEDVIALTREDDIYFLGDYIDRGPRSREVLQYIMGLVDSGYRVYPLRGNHEEMFLKACTDRNEYRTWLLNGGCTALDSFGVNDASEVPAPFYRFCSGLPYYYLLDDYLLVHAGFNPEAEEPFNDTQSMLWSRPRAMRRELTGGRTVICGHTPHPIGEIEKMLKRGSALITLDNGCFLGSRKGTGSLLALELNTRTLYAQKNIDSP